MPQEFCLTNPLKAVLVEVLNKGTEKSKRCYSKRYMEKKYIPLHIYYLKKTAKEKRKINQYYPSLGIVR